MLDRNDIFYFDKLKVIEVLSLKDDIIFVGGTSEYLQGLKNNLNDIDITITDINCLKDIGYIHRFYQNIFFNLSGNRGVIKLKNVLIDIFIEDKKPDYIIYNNFKCETVDSMINLRQNTLDFNLINNKKIEFKIKYNLNRLKKWKQLQS